MGNEIKLERFQENIHSYYRIELTACDYFETVEYRMFCCNHWEPFLPVLLREKDDKKWALYRTDGKVALEERSRQGDLSLILCRGLVKNILEVMGIVGENMLELSHVCLRPEYIFLDREDRCYFCYLPYGVDSVREDFERLAAWMLSKVDYDDSEAVKFVYHLHWCLRKEELSEDLLKNCLLGSSNGGSGSGESADRTKRKPDLAEVWNRGGPSLEEKMEGYKKDESRTNIEEGKEKGQISDKEKTDWTVRGAALIQEETGKGEEDRNRRKKLDPEGPGRSVGRRIGQIILIGICALSLLAVIVLLYIGNSYGFTRLNARIMIALLGVAACSGAAVYLLSSNRKDGSGVDDISVDGTKMEGQIYGGERYYKGAGEFMTDPEEKRYDQGRDQVWDYSRSESCSGEENEDEDGTVILGIHKEEQLPSLQDADSGELLVLYDDPWYIGSGKNNCHLWINTRTVSRRHAKIFKSRDSDELLIMDLDSTNGTKVNGITLIPEVARSLSDGDQISFADRQYIFLAGKRDISFMS